MNEWNAARIINEWTAVRIIIEHKECPNCGASYKTNDLYNIFWRMKL